MKPRLIATLWCLLAACVAGEPDFVAVRPLLEQHCFDCHGDEEKPKGGVNLERFRTDGDVMQDRNVWASAFEKIESHQMPPPKRESQPAMEQRKQIMAWIMDIAARPDAALGARDPGKPVLRRLTRLEYNNSIRDLLQLDSDVFIFPERLPLTDKAYFQPASGKLGDQLQVKLREYGGKYRVLLPQAGLPADGRAEHGFRNRGDAMNFSPLLLEKYVALAASIVNHPELPQRSAVFADLLGVERESLPKVTIPKGDCTANAASVFAPNAPALKRAVGMADDAVLRFRQSLAEAVREGRGGVFDGADVNAGATTIPGKGAEIRVSFGPAGSQTLTINPNADLWLAAFSTAEATSGRKLLTNHEKGRKSFELTFGMDRDQDDEGITMLAVCVLGRKSQSGEVSLTARFTDGTETTVTAFIEADATFFSFDAVPGETIKSLAVDGAKFSGDYVLLDDLAFITNVKSSSRVVSKPEPKKVVPKLTPLSRLANFVEQAFRRKASAEEHQRFQGLFETVMKSGKSEAEALRVAAQAVLSSASFLFLSEPIKPDAPKVRPLDDFELASRLSYFLWSSAPDEELLTVARTGRLSIEAQTRRMLRDPKARELSESFAVQWLRLDQLYTSKPDRDLFKAFYSGPQGKDTLHGAMLVEALLLFETVLSEDRSILDFTHADYTWLNPRLAKLYGITLPNGRAANDEANPNTTRELKKGDKDADNQWHRVALTNQARGGYFTMAGPLTVTSLPFRTSPVKRGAWLLETLFNRPPTEPKVAFAVENDTKEAAQAMSIRQRFEAHRDKAACYSCHIRLDPPGFALERFDAIGTWRERDGGAPVDAKGEWNGTAFEGPAGYKALLAANPDEFVRGFIEHLLSYALGRKLEIYDMPAVDEIQRRTAEDNYKLSRIILEIVKSYAFRNVRNIGTQ